jgi:hypothetical protein
MFEGTYLHTYWLNIIILYDIHLKMSCGIFTLGHVSQYKIIQTFELNVLNYFKIIIRFIF